jgi:DedD protein
MQGTRRRDGFSSARNEPRALVLQPRPWYNRRGLTSHTPDDGFHEIQLNGKQLVFLFMAATVVSVVIFLCGVLVGRGVRAERGAPDSAALVDVPIVDQTTATAGAPAGSDPRNAPPPAAVDDLSYFNRLEKPETGQDDLKQSSPKAPAPDMRQTARAAETPPVAVPPASTKPPSPKPPSTKPPSAKPASTPTPAPVPVTAPPAAPQPAAARLASSPAAGGKPSFAVQLAALNSRSEADAMVRRLSAKGYEAYVQDPAAGGPSIFRVRVGNYPTRGEAETVAAKLEKEGQFKPWVAAR